MEERPKMHVGAMDSMTFDFEQVRDQLHDLGLTLSVWDHFGDVVEGFEPSCDLCARVGGLAQRCREEARKIAEHVVFSDRPIKGQSPLGGCIIGVPVHERRRLVAAAVACFPVAEMLESEQLHRLCDRSQLDHESIVGELASRCHYSLAGADRLIDALTKMLDREQSLRVAEDGVQGLSENLASTYEELSLVYRISGTMKLTREPQVFLREDVCGELLEVMGVQYAAAVLYPHAPTQGPVEVIAAGDLDLKAEQVRRLAAVDIAPQFMGNVRSLVDNHFAGNGRSSSHKGIDKLVAVPLSGDNQPIGILLAANKATGEFNSVDVKLLSAIGSQAVVFLTNHRLYADLQELLLGVLEALTASIDAKDPYTCGHSWRVAKVSERLAIEMGYSRERVRQIYLAGLLHDVGKIGVPESVLRKPGRLNEEEYDQIKRHPTIAAKILGGIRQLDEVATGILTHHERLDGRGYPQSLSESELPMEGRIIGLADSFDAMTSDRCYRPALSLPDVIEELRRHAGTQFDPELVEKFLAIDLNEFLIELRSDDRQFKPLAVGKERQE